MKINLKWCLFNSFLVISFLISPLIIPKIVSAINLTENICKNAKENGYKDINYQYSNSIYLKAEDLCLMDLSIQEKKPLICDDIMFNKKSASLYCYTKYSVEFKKPEVCENVSGTNTGDDRGTPLKYSCYREYAKKTNDEKVCSQVHIDEKDSCYSDIAKSTNDSSICKKINNKNTQSICYEQLGIFTGKCANEGEKFSRVYRDEFPSHCCTGLTEWESGMDTRKVENGMCINTNLVSGYPVGICIKSGDGICGKNENICNSPKDCKSSDKVGFFQSIIKWFFKIF